MNDSPNFDILLCRQPFKHDIHKKTQQILIMWHLDNAHRFRLCVEQDIFKLTV